MVDDEKHIDYLRIEQAILYIREHLHDQPCLQEIASAVNLSPFHFQRLFSLWAGVSPKKFMQYLSLEYAKSLLYHSRSTLLDTAYTVGLSSSSRLHELFVKIEAMTPGQYQSGGANLDINYCFTQSPFGRLIVASTHKGICHMFFAEDDQAALHTLRNRFPNATLHATEDLFQQEVLHIFQANWTQPDSIKLHLAGTPFQLKVWEALLKIPMGSLATYGDIATALGKPKSSRAVGTAIAKNPIAFLIPCHRIIRSTGDIGQYMWGPTRKSAMIGWEAAKASL